MFHIAEINVGTLLAPTDSPVVAEFMEALAPVNALADTAPGFMWRLQSESGDATDILFSDDPCFIINMSVWESIEALRDYAYKTAHVEYLRRRQEWFLERIEMHLAMWWVPAGEVPTPEEGMRRLALIREQGPTAEAFTLARPFAAPEAAPTG